MPNAATIEVPNTFFPHYGRWEVENLGLLHFLDEMQLLMQRAYTQSTGENKMKLQLAVIDPLLVAI